MIIHAFSSRFIVLMVLLIAAPITQAFIGSCYDDSYPKNFTIAMQEQLINKGFDPGAVDGKWGNKTRKAMSDFQRAFRIPEADLLNGVPTGATLRALFGSDFRPDMYGLSPNGSMPKDFWDEYCR